MSDALLPGVRLDETVSGDGFGLTIVKELAELYGGGVTLQSDLGGGLHVELRLPALATTARHVSDISKT